MASLPRATYYFELNKPDKDIKNKEIMELIQNIFYENKQRYGFKRITAELRNRGYLINHKKVLRLMAKLGLRAVKKKQKYHSYIGEVGHIADNLINRNFIAHKPNEKWTTDVSQFNCSFGKCYLSPIIDMGKALLLRALIMDLPSNVHRCKAMRFTLNITMKIEAPSSN